MGLFLAVALQCGCAAAQEGAPEKRVTFYTTYGYQNASGWNIPFKIWVHEEPDFARRLVARMAQGELQERADIEELTAAQKDRFIFRTHGFIADSESRERVHFRFDSDPENALFEIRDANGHGATDRNGLIEGSITITRERAQQLLRAQKSASGWLTFGAVSDNHGGVGRVRLIEPLGLSVISDVDDTIKVTEIPLGETAVLRNTFFEEFRATPCMESMYSSMDTTAAFHYVSGGPWQMYQPLREFLFSDRGGFPEGSFHMKNVRTNPFESESYQDIWSLIASGSQQVTFDQKVQQISELLRRFPERDFILIGDSGEKDPEVFAEIRGNFADQLVEIRIRDVVNDAENNPGRLEGMTVILPDANADGSCQLLRP